MDQERDRQIKQRYLEGARRADVRKEFGFEKKNNSMSSLSNRLGLHWSWPLANRRSGVEPEDHPLRKACREKGETLRAKRFAALREKRALQRVTPQQPRADTSMSLGEFNERHPRVKPARLNGAVEPLHLSRAFPKPKECGLTAAELFALSRCYAANASSRDAL